MRLFVGCLFVLWGFVCDDAFALANKQHTQRLTANARLARRQSQPFGSARLRWKQVKAVRKVAAHGPSFRPCTHGHASAAAMRRSSCCYLLVCGGGARWLVVVVRVQWRQKLDVCAVVRCSVPRERRRRRRRQPPGRAVASRMQDPRAPQITQRTSLLSVGADGLVLHCGCCCCAALGAGAWPIAVALSVCSYCGRPTLYRSGAARWQW